MKLYIGPHEVPEYGTVLVYTCSQSCWKDNTEGGSGCRREWAFVQPDPDESVMDSLPAWELGLIFIEDNFIFYMALLIIKSKYIN